MKIKEFEDLIWEFINDNVECRCAVCMEHSSELNKSDYKGSWEKAIKELFEKVRGVK